MKEGDLFLYQCKLVVETIHWLLFSGIFPEQEIPTEENEAAKGTQTHTYPMYCKKSNTCTTIAVVESVLDMGASD